jgi:hypothetical protein
MRLENEEQLLDIAFRVKVIESIFGAENIARKKEARRRYEVYKDKTSKFVIKSLESEGLKPTTIAQMSNRASNISICRKVVNKLARAYAAGVTREGGSEAETEQIGDLARVLGFDDKMRKADRYRELYRNCMLQVVSEEADLEAELYKLKIRVLSPWQYDVIEDTYDRERARVVILSDFDEATVDKAVSAVDAGKHKRSASGGVARDGQDTVIADSPDDAKTCEIVWWSEKYHFVTDLEGKITGGPEGQLNPVEKLPFVNNAEDQDGQFWAQGGDDLIDGSILTNKVITDMNYIAYLQGYGQFVVTGKNLPEKIALGPNNAIMLEHDKEDPTPSVTVLSSSPPLADWMSIVEQYVALLLTTNNLSPSNIAGKLDATQFASGIAMLIEMSEATNEIEDKQKQYTAIERELWDLVGRWHRLLVEADQVFGDLAELDPLPEDADVSVRFNELKPVQTEKERLEIIKARKDLGINEEVDLILMDNPDMSRAAALEKLAAIKKERAEAVEAMAMETIKDGEQVDQAEEKDEEQDGGDAEKKPKGKDFGGAA